jgi:hypothetical protein
MGSSSGGLSSSTGTSPLGPEGVVPSINILGRQVERSHPFETRLHEFVAVNQPLWDILLSRYSQTTSAYKLVATKRWRPW